MTEYIHEIPARDIKAHQQSLECWCVPYQEIHNSDESKVYVKHHRASDEFMQCELKRMQDAAAAVLSIDKTNCLAHDLMQLKAAYNGISRDVKYWRDRAILNNLHEESHDLFRSL